MVLVWFVVVSGFDDLNCGMAGLVTVGWFG